LQPLPNANFPLITSNYDFSDTVLAGKFPRWKVFKRSGVKIGVYGLGIELDGLVRKSQFGNTVYHDPLKTALKMEKFLKEEKKCQLVVCLSHLGLKYKENKISDLTLAPETFHTDLIIGGHTHTFLEEPISVKNKNGREIIVNQAWWGGLVVGKIDFVIERYRNKKQAVFAANIT
jgi:5'-nucleotidase